MQKKPVIPLIWKASQNFPTKTNFEEHLQELDDRARQCITFNRFVPISPTNRDVQVLNSAMRTLFQALVVY